MRYEVLNEGDGARKHAVYDMPIWDPNDYWANVTDVQCPVCKAGFVRWHEAGYVPGSRICDGCGRYFQAHGSLKVGRITLVRDKRFDKPKTKPCANCKHLEKLIVILTEARDANAIALKSAAKQLGMATDELVRFREAVKHLERAKREGDQLAQESAIARLTLLSSGVPQRMIDEHGKNQ